MKNKPEFIYLATIIIISLITRIPGLDLMPVDDEADWLAATLGQVPDYRSIYHPPLGLTIYAIFQDILGHRYQNVRLASMFFGILTLITTYFIAKEIYGKRIAMISGLIMSITYYPVLASLQIDVEGAILTFFVSATFYSFTKYLNTERRFWQYVAGISFGFCLLAKYSSILIIPVLIGYIAIYNRKKLPTLLIPIAIGGVIGLIYPVAAYMTGNWTIFTNTFGWGQENLRDHHKITIVNSVIKHIYRLVQDGTILFIVFPLIAFFNRLKKEENILYLWSAIYFLFYALVVRGGPISKYLMIIIPPLVILTSRSTDLMLGHFGKKDIIRVVCITMALFIIITIQNSTSQTTEPFTLERKNFEVLAKNADIWYSSSSGPIFRVSTYSFLFTLFGSAMTILALCICKSHRKNLIILLISINLAFSLFMTEELIYHRYSPDYNTVMQEMITYYKNHDLKEPLYSFNEDFAYFLTTGNFMTEKTYYDLESKEDRSTLGSEGGTAVIMNIPKTMSLTDAKYPGYTILKSVDENCILRKTFYIGNYDAGYIYECRSKQ